MAGLEILDFKITCWPIHIVFTIIFLVEDKSFLIMKDAQIMIF